MKWKTASSVLLNRKHFKSISFNTTPVIGQFWAKPRITNLIALTFLLSAAGSGMTPFKLVLAKERTCNKWNGTAAVVINSLDPIQSKLRFTAVPAVMQSESRWDAIQYQLIGGTKLKTGAAQEVPWRPKGFHSALSVYVMSCNMIIIEVNRMLRSVSNTQIPMGVCLSCWEEGRRGRCGCMHLCVCWGWGVGGLSNLFQQFRLPLQGTQLFLLPLCSTATATELKIECCTASNQRL